MQDTSIPTKEALGISTASTSIQRQATVLSASTTKAPTLSNTPKQRPAFNTLQQHYSPAKSSLPKPPIPPLRPPPPELATSSNTFETTKAQAELLYLSLLHEGAHSSLEQFEQSAGETLQKNFDALRKTQQALSLDERAIQEQVNLTELARWRDEAGSGAHVSTDAHLSESLQRLSACLSELILLSAPDGQYRRLMTVFSNWLTPTENLFEARNTSTYISETTWHFIAPLDQQWHEAHDSCSRRLRLLERDIGLLPVLSPLDREDESSSPALRIILNFLTAFSAGIREELDLTLRIERQVLEKEKQWVEKAIEGLDLGLFLQENHDVSPVAAWHVQKALDRA